MDRMGFMNRIAAMAALAGITLPGYGNAVTRLRAGGFRKHGRLRGHKTRINNKPFTKRKDPRRVPYVKLNYRRSDPRHLQHARFCRNANCECHHEKVAA